MINLIDADAKRDLKAARANVVLVTYCLVVAATVLCVVGLFLFSHWWLNKTIADAAAQKTANDAKTAPYQTVKDQAAAFSLNLGKIQSVLNNRSHYSTALLNIAESLPSGAYLNTVTFSPTFLTTPLKISANTPTNQAALTLKATLTQSPIYSKVTLDSVNCGGLNGSSCAVSLTATLNQKVFTPGAVE